ncbi:acetyl-CoA carboxylase biotin carboxyl carrier protein subunit [Heliorestis convoluta]|uniref:Acetyl-CoA carboxylase biotin carboxyl carrier protein subunit n=1 Tax=Heliorestis convoluta TaxID=356322 RepID=A0A5Q2MXQ0_9FIRM|nr:acetyl-CoA carboxylase biotin carboxyl carrier protein subunit [Heliorestis convoluta]QGG47428.1 acetyl-CoA carboxylase biotin carboxyl carrier protein subunit [Heliorestis convoluta]
MKEVTATMAGMVLRLQVNPGDKVEENQEVLYLESMKMEIPVQSTFAGTVVESKVAEGEFVNEGDVLLLLE